MKRPAAAGPGVVADATRMRALEGLEAMLAEDAEYSVRHLIELGWSPDAAADSYEHWVRCWTRAACKRGATRAGS